MFYLRTVFLALVMVSSCSYPFHAAEDELEDIFMSWLVTQVEIVQAESSNAVDKGSANLWGRIILWPTILKFSTPTDGVGIGDGVGAGSGVGVGAGSGIIIRDYGHYTGEQLDTILEGARRLLLSLDSVQGKVPVPGCSEFRFVLLSIIEQLKFEKDQVYTQKQPPDQWKTCLGLFITAGMDKV